MSIRRVVLTGGPGGGKTTAAELFRRELAHRVAIVPEAATLLYSGGFPRSPLPAVRRAAQRAIYHVQRGLEEAHAASYPEKLLLCDRGTVDGGAYWPGEPREFFATVGTSLEDELAHYDAVLFLEASALGGVVAEGGSPARVETLAEASAIDARLRGLWSAHPRFTLVPHDASFFRKLSVALVALTGLLGQ